MNLVFIAASSFMLALSGALVPGPLFTITVSESVKRGFIAGPLIILGHGILELVIILLIIMGITPFLQRESTRLVISVIGGVILIIMGIMLFRDAKDVKLEFTGKEEERKRFGPVLSGVIGSISNPYWTIWWVTIGLGYLMSSLRFGIMGVVAFFIGHITADLAWYSIISYAVSKGRRLIGDKGYRSMLYVCGVFLILFGGWFLTGFKFPLNQ
jgi:threonine/homoserine/homoserine lactone efflux protein